jgi:hypothetical protein
MDLNKALENLKYDSRMKDWNVKQGVLTRDDLEKHLKTLKDSTTDCENLTLEDKGDFSDR